MTQFADLTPYTYCKMHSDIQPVNIGWLGKGYSFDTRVSSNAFLIPLENLVKNHKVHYFRGSHCCDFCPSVTDKIDDRCGNGTVIVIGADNKAYAAPALIYHYVFIHLYKPPKEFVEAVINGKPLTTEIY